MTVEAQLVADCFERVFSPRSKSGLGGWMAEHIYLRPTENPSAPGFYRPDYTPHVAKLFDLFFSDPQWEELISQKGSQASLSLHALGLIVRRVAEDPVNMIYVIDSKEEAKNISQRLRDKLEDCEMTRAAVVEAEEEMRLLKFDLPGMNLWLTGAGSAGALANKAAVIAVADEVDKHERTKGEADTIDLLRSRLKDQPGGRLIAFSTPTTVDGQIHREFSTGSRHRYHVPCPHCGHFQVLVPERLKFSHCKDLVGVWDMAEVRRDTWYECEECKERIDEGEKRGMMLKGEWRPTNFREVADAGEKRMVPNWEPGKLSAHFSDIYSQSPKVAWGRLAMKIIQAAGRPERVHDLNNNNFGEPNRSVAGEVTEEKILNLRGAYQRGGRLPIDPCMAAVIADTQDASSKALKVAYEADGTVWVLDWFEVLGLEGVVEEADEPVEGRSEEVPIHRVLYDEGGHRTMEVRKFVLPRWPRCSCSKGGEYAVTKQVWQWRDFSIDGRPGTQVPVLVYHDDVFKRSLYIDKIARFDPERWRAIGGARIWLPSNLDEQIVKELQGESYEKTLNQKWGTERWGWRRVGKNDYGDCLKMALILWATVEEEFEEERKALEARRAEA